MTKNKPQDTAITCPHCGTTWKKEWLPEHLKDEYCPFCERKYDK